MMLNMLIVVLSKLASPLQDVLALHLWAEMYSTL